MTTLTPEYFVSRWSAPTSPRLIKGQLIDEAGHCCAQGDVLRCAGYTDQQLRLFAPETADREVARLLGLTIAESALLRIVNDSEDGCPQDVFVAPERVLGPHYRLWTAFVRHIEQMRKEDWERVAAAATAAGFEACAAAGEAAWDAAEIAAGAEARAAARDAAGAAAGAAAGVEAAAAAGAAAWELIGFSKLLEEPFFLGMFFPDPHAWVESVESIDED